MSAVDPLLLHEDPDLFREAVAFTAARIGFAARLIEKDYYCSVVLARLAAASAGLVFKGGTCLAKVHADFYRLSEDLDFVIPTPVDATRPERSRRAAAAKDVLLRLGQETPGLRLETPLTGFNASTQYNGALAYSSLLAETEERVAVEVSLREPLLAPEVPGQARTLLLDPIRDAVMVPPVVLPCLSWPEAMAEKLRAALTRRKPAIRDFYDVDYAVQKHALDAGEPALLEFVRRKLDVPGNERVDVSPSRRAELEAQLEARLRPVLRDADFAAFDLGRAFDIVARVAAALEGGQ